MLTRIQGVFLLLPKALYAQRFLTFLFCVLLTSFQAPAWADSQDQRIGFIDGAKMIGWELGLVGGGATYLGLKNWNWGSSNSFKFVNEGWFGSDAGSGGTDKLGHMYTTYLMDEFFTHRLHNKTNNWKESARLGAYYSGLIMLIVEIFDGYSDDHGFSYEDMVMNASGIGLSYLRNTVPGLHDKFDFRLSYEPTEERSDRPITDYSGMTYIAALKPAGFQSLKKTPLKYVEFQLGYHADGFKSSDNLDRQRQEVTFGLSVDLQQVLFNPIRQSTQNKTIKKVVDTADTFSRYYQFPNMAVTSVVYDKEIETNN